MADPSDLFAYDELARLLKRDIDLAAVAESQLLHTIDRVYRRTDQISGRGFWSRSRKAVILGLVND